MRNYLSWKVCVLRIISNSRQTFRQHYSAYLIKWHVILSKTVIAQPYDIWLEINHTHRACYNWFEPQRTLLSCFDLGKPVTYACEIWSQHAHSLPSKRHFETRYTSSISFSDKVCLVWFISVTSVFLVFIEVNANNIFFLFWVANRNS